MGQGWWHQEVYWSIQPGEIWGSKEDKSRACQISLKTSGVQWATGRSQEEEGDWTDHGRVPGRRGQGNEWGCCWSTLTWVGVDFEKEEDRWDKHSNRGGGARKEDQEN